MAGGGLGSHFEEKYLPAAETAEWGVVLFSDVDQGQEWLAQPDAIDRAPFVPTARSSVESRPAITVSTKSLTRVAIWAVGSGRASQVAGCIGTPFHGRSVQQLWDHEPGVMMATIPMAATPGVLRVLMAARQSMFCPRQKALLSALNPAALMTTAFTSYARYRPGQGRGLRGCRPA